MRRMTMTGKRSGRARSGHVRAAARWSLVAALLLLPAVRSARAAALAGVTLPDQVTVEGQTLVLNGLGLREATLLKVDVYVAGLYLPGKTGDAARILASDGPWRLVMHFVRDVSRKEIVKAWDEGFAKNAPGERAALADRIGTFSGWMADVKVGETLVFTCVPAKGTEVEVRGAVKGVIAGADFARALLSIWIGPSPPNPGLKTGLLGTGP